MRKIFVGKIGSGKTTFCIEQALKAIHEGKKVLWLCPNQNFVNHIFERISGHLFATDIKFHNIPSTNTIYVKDKEIHVLSKEAYIRNYPRYSNSHWFKIYDEMGIDYRDFDIVTVTGEVTNKLREKLR